VKVRPFFHDAREVLIIAVAQIPADMSRNYRQAHME
jgi:hypothetical protein